MDPTNHTLGEFDRAKGIYMVRNSFMIWRKNWEFPVRKLFVYSEGIELIILPQTCCCSRRYVTSPEVKPWQASEDPLSRGDDEILHRGMVEKSQGDIRCHPEAKSVTPQGLVQVF